MRVAPPDTGDD